ncbi:hypothetical protein NY_014-036 [NY_014 poxvirus]|uniref:hypothetical protein n=1 Tax=NY_014 poxvirus TaxID=2025360 RepID=UPI000B9A0BBA|nr:hypothetical protein CKM51_gp036 [NY_014 poxvirus]AST09437.1 hypothetical protein NY_014-036 [NY_014 poxvirus]
MSKLLKFIKNKIIDIFINDLPAYSPVKTIEEPINTSDEDFYTANHGFDCVELVDEIDECSDSEGFL